MEELPWIFKTDFLGEVSYFRPEPLGITAGGTANGTNNETVIRDGRTSAAYFVPQRQFMDGKGGNRYIVGVIDLDNNLPSFSTC